MMEASRSDVDRRIAENVRGLRAGRSLSLEALAERSGVSRSMISLVERGEASPTAVLLERLAGGLGVPLASLFDGPVAGGAATPSGPLARRGEQPEWRDPASGYRRRNVSPPGAPQPMRIVDVHFPAGARVAFDNAAPEIRTQQQIWVLAGALDVSLGRERHRLHEGDCLAMDLDRPIAFHNPTRRTTRYAVVTASQPRRRR